MCSLTRKCVRHCLRCLRLFKPLFSLAGFLFLCIEEPTCGANATSCSTYWLGGRTPRRHRTLFLFLRFQRLSLIALGG